MAFRWMDLSDWLSYRYLVALLLYQSVITFCLTLSWNIFLGQLVMIQGAYAPPFASGRILVMHT